MNEEYKGDILLEWEVPEYVQHKRSLTWFLVFGVIVGFFFIISIATANFLFSLLIVLFTIILFFNQNRKPNIVSFKIRSLGIELGDQFMPYRMISKFWILYYPPQVKKLYIVRKTLFNTELVISLEDINPLMVRNLLLQYVMEDLDKEEESLYEIMARVFKL